MRVESDGKVIVSLTDGTEFVRGQVLVQTFLEPFLLKGAPGGLLTGLAAAGPVIRTADSEYNQTASIHAGALEIFIEPEPLILPSRESVRLHITGEPDMTWLIQATTNLTDWVDLGMVSPTVEEMEFCDPASTLQPRRFYRILQR